MDIDAPSIRCVCEADEDQEYKPVFVLAVRLMEIENLIRYTALAVGLMKIEK
jgi:hypothetical protein